MAKAVGGALRLFATFFYFMDLLISAAILGIYSYYIATLHRNNLPIDNQWRAVEGLSGGAALYSIFAVLLTCCLGGVGFFAFLGMAFDLICCGAMIAIAVLVRHGAQTCNSGTTNTPLGSGRVSGTTRTGLSLRIACDLDLVVLILAGVGALFFLISFLLQLLVNRHHANEKHQGPNTRDMEAEGGEKRGLFGRRAKTTREAYDLGPQMGVAEGGATSGTTLGQQNDAYVNHNNKYGNNAPNKYETYAPVPAPQAAPVPVSTGPNIVSSSTTTHDAVYDPYAKPSTTGPAGFANPVSDYIPGSVQAHQTSTNY